MSGHVHHEIYLHINWHTHGDDPLIEERLEAMVYRSIEKRCRGTKGVYFHGVGGTPTHVHLAINIEPFVVISDLIGEVKGGSAHDVNEAVGRKALVWQRGFGVTSFGAAHLPWVLDYIRHQKAHHGAGTVHARLETASGGPAEGG